jgi:hypothetical protein
MNFAMSKNLLSRLQCPHITKFINTTGLNIQSFRGATVILVAANLWRGYW